ncbi:MAG: DUF4349 domain-containing protein [Chitinophagaceae bacterium]|nr:MAG: DUF4349 domain-containing protein [Chitinophagaceae bacterium]
MRKLFYLSATIFAIVFFSSCNTGSEGKGTSELRTAEALENGAATNDGLLQIPVSPIEQQLGDTVSSVKTKPEPTSWEKKIIKTGDLSVEAKSLKSFSESLQPLLAKNGAYIAKEESRQGEGYHSSHWVIKVPVLQFEDLMTGLAMKDATVTQRSINSDDVTTAWFDTRSRLEAKRAMRNKYAEFLNKAKNMEEVLQVQQEINRLQEEIESATGRMNALGSQSAYSTINLDVTEKGSAFAPAEETPGVFKRLVMAFKTGADGFAYLLVGLVSIWPLILVLVIGIYFLRRKNSKVIVVKQ